MLQQNNELQEICGKFEKTYRPSFANETLDSSPTSSATVLFVFLFLCLNGWLHNIWCYFTSWYYSSKHVEPWKLCTTRTLMCVLCNLALSLLSDTQCSFLLLLFLDISYTKIHTTQWPIDWHTYINIYEHHLYCTQLSVLHWMNNSLISKFTFNNVFYFQKLHTCRSHISRWLYWIWLSSSCETQIILIIMV